MKAAAVSNTYENRMLMLHFDKNKQKFATNDRPKTKFR